jgi:hypothetical protein
MRKDDYEWRVRFTGKSTRRGVIAVKPSGGAIVMNQLGVVAWQLIDWNRNILMNQMGVVI